MDDGAWPRGAAYVVNCVYALGLFWVYNMWGVCPHADRSGVLIRFMSFVPPDPNTLGYMFGLQPEVQSTRQGAQGPIVEYCVVCWLHLQCLAKW